MRQIIIDCLENLLENTNDREVGIFETYREREEVVVSVNDEQTQSEGTDGVSEGEIQNDDTSRNEQCEARGTGNSDQAEQATTREVTTTIRRDNKVRILTVEGAQFVNAILDSWVAKRPTDYFMNELYLVGSAKHPSLNLFRVINTSGVSYYTKDKEIFDVQDEALVLNYPGKNDLEIDWIRDENGRPYMPLSPERYAMMWNRIIKASKTIDAKKVSCNKELTKPVLYWEDIKVAFDEKGRIMRKDDASLSFTDLMLTSILKPTWKVPVAIFCREEANRNWSRTDLIHWLCQPIDNNNNKVENTNVNNNASKPGSRFSKISNQG